MAAGRGPITRDGCAVEVYRRFPYRGELELLAPHLPRGCSVLELGCGAGRLTRPLLERGFRVTAVDNSLDMLAHVPAEATKVHADIESLDLGRTFDVALLASNLVNTPDDALRHAQLTACRRHLHAGARLIFQRFDPDWFQDVQPGFFPAVGDVTIEVERVARHEGLTDMSVLYTHGEEQWRHGFTARLLDDEAASAVLAAAGFPSVEWIDAKWGVAPV